MAHFCPECAVRSQGTEGADGALHFRIQHRHTDGPASISGSHVCCQSANTGLRSRGSDSGHWCSPRSSESQAGLRGCWSATCTSSRLLRRAAGLGTTLRRLQAHEPAVAFIITVEVLSWPCARSRIGGARRTASRVPAVSQPKSRQHAVSPLAPNSASTLLQRHPLTSTNPTTRSTT